MDKIKILEIVPSLSQSNGVAAFISNYFENFNKEKFDFTFLVVRDTTNRLRFDEFEKKGAKIVEIPLSKNIVNYNKKIDLFFKENKFDIVHCNVPTLSMIYLKYAKRNNCNIRIIHSHGTKAGDTFFKNIRNRLLIKFGINYANTYFACSKVAGKTMFGNKKFYIIHNAIDYKKFTFNEEIRNEYRKSFNVENKMVIGCVGRYMIQKNHKYIIDVMKEVVKTNSNIVLYIIGGGFLEEKLQKQINIYGLNNNVVLLGIRKDVSKLYNMFDLFVLPSLYEGLPVVGIEAQANGLKCIFSKRITKEVSISNNTEFIDIKEKDKQTWKQTILNINTKRTNFDTLLKDYEINYSTDKVEKIFEGLVLKNKYGGQNE